MKISKLKIFEKITDYADGTCRDIIFSGVKWSGIKSYIQKLVNIYSNVEWHVRSPEDEAVDSDKQNGMMPHLARDYAFYAELHKRACSFTVRIICLQLSVHKVISIFGS